MVPLSLGLSINDLKIAALVQEAFTSLSSGARLCSGLIAGNCNSGAIANLSTWDTPDYSLR